MQRKFLPSAVRFSPLMERFWPSQNWRLYTGMSKSKGKRLGTERIDPSDYFLDGFIVHFLTEKVLPSMEEDVRGSKEIIKVDYQIANFSQMIKSNLGHTFPRKWKLKKPWYSLRVPNVHDTQGNPFDQLTDFLVSVTM